MSWFDASSFTSFAKTAIEGAQRSIDKVLDIDEGSVNASQSTKGDSNAAKPKQSRLGAKTTTKPVTSTQKSISPPKKISPRKQTSTDTGSDAESSSVGDFWSSFLGGSTKSDDSSTSSKSPASLSSAGRDNSASLKSSLTSSLSKAAKTGTQNDRPKCKVSGTSLSTRIRQDKRKEKTGEIGSKNDKECKSQTEEDFLEVIDIADDNSRKQDRRKKEVKYIADDNSRKHDRSKEEVAEIGSKNDKDSNSQTKHKDLEEKEIVDDKTRKQDRSKEAGEIGSKNEGESSSQTQQNSSKTKYIADAKSDAVSDNKASKINTVNLTDGNKMSEIVTKNASPDSSGAADKNIEIEVKSSDDETSCEVAQSVDEKDAKGDSDVKVSGTPDILQDISNSGSESSAEGGHINKLVDDSIPEARKQFVDEGTVSSSGDSRISLKSKTDLEKSVSHKDISAKSKGPDMVDGLENIPLANKLQTSTCSKSEGEVLGVATDGLGLDLVCDNSYVNKTQDIGSDFEPMAASTPFQSKEKLWGHEKLPKVVTNYESQDKLNESDGASEISLEQSDKHDKDTSIKGKTDAERLNGADKSVQDFSIVDEDSEQSVSTKESSKDNINEPCKGDNSSTNEEIQAMVLIQEEGTPKVVEEINEKMDREPSSVWHSAVTEQDKTLGNAAKPDDEERSVDGDKTEALIKEVASLKEVVEAREKKMVELSKDNIDLQETTAILRSQLAQLESVHIEDDSEMDKIREEFTIRVAETENKLQAAARERDQMKRELEETSSHLTALNERQYEEFTTLISEKDEQIAELLAEGEKLSKQELQSNTIIKKLRAKEKENDSLIKKQTKKIEDLETEVKQLTEVLASRDENHCKQEDAIIKLDAYAKKQQDQIAKLKSELDDASEKTRSLQTALDNAYKELTELHKDKATKENMTQDAVFSAEVNAKEELRIMLEKARREFNQESEHMALQISDLQSSLSRAEQQSIRREDSLRQEISDLQQRLQEAEGRNQELATSVSHATRPLLRQIENLQHTHSNQASTWEKVEKNLTERFNEAQAQLLTAQGKERLASQNASQALSHMSGLESQVTSYRTDRSRLEAELELERTKIRTLEDTLSRETAKAEASQSKFKKLIEEANQDKAYAQQQLAVEMSRIETERKKLKAALDEKEKRLSRQSSFGSFAPPSPTTTNDLGAQFDTSFSTPQRGHARTGSMGSSVIDGITRGMMGGATASVVERLQAQVRAKEGEVDLLQDDLVALEKSRDSVTEELLRMTSRLEGLETSHEELTELRTKYKELQQRYNAVLQMYGEKEEEAEELRMDLQDVKSMYKQQLEQLFGNR